MGLPVTVFPGVPFDTGTRVAIRAKDYFYEYVNGWIGTIVGYPQGGVAQVEVVTTDGVKTFFVTQDQLERVPE
jgi:hypothetical protein